MRLAGVGIVVGIGCGLAVTRLIANLLFNVPPYDPTTFLSVSALVGGVAFVAAWFPAWRAAHVDPLLALRQE
jgi:ABC-type antimicrobial peptide transport system permease subunit